MIEQLEWQLENAEEHLDIIDGYGGNAPSDDEEGWYDAERWERVQTELRARLDGKWKVERSARMRDVVHWAAKAVTGKFLPPEILAMVHGYISLEDDEEDFRDCDTDSEIYKERGKFGVDDEDKCDASD
ncbi:hypothetical protein MMC29_004342 [Sticta canariensis]|nr:hypothetical protein [Sticta canariensis]